MKELKIRNKNGRNAVYYVDDANGGLRILRKNGSVEPYAKRLIELCGGRGAVLSACNSGRRIWLTERLRDTDYNSYINDIAEADYMEVFGTGGVVEATADNIRVLLRFLNTMNWGRWPSLPEMSVGYVCRQYEVNDEPATTIILDEAIDVNGEMYDRFVVNAQKACFKGYKLL